MKYYSEVTKKFYENEKDCAKAEKSFLDKSAEKEKEAKRLAEEKTARAKEITDAYKASVEAEKTYLNLRNKFIEDYGYFHMSYYDKDASLPNLFDIFRW